MKKYIGFVNGQKIEMTVDEFQNFVPVRELTPHDIISRFSYDPINETSREFKNAKMLVEFLPTILKDMRDTQRVNAVKLVILLTNWTLKEGSDYLESL